jgi:hypothetical protein
MNSISKVAALVAVSAVSSAASAALIDNFTTTSVLSRTGAGTITQTTPASGAIGGNRFESVGVLAGGGVADLKVNSPLVGIGALSSETGVDSLFGLTYGNAADLNASFSLDSAFIIRLKKSDIGSTNNTITVTSTGIGSASASFSMPALVGLGGPASPFDVSVPFSSFSGAAVDFGDIDKIAFSFNPQDSADWQIQLLGTTSVPEPSALGLMASAGLLLTRRRRV